MLYINDIIKIFNVILTRKGCLILFLINLASLVFYKIDLPLVQSILEGRISDYYFSYILLFAHDFLKINNIIFIFLWIVCLVWVGTLKSLAKKILVVGILLYTIIGNIIVLLSFVMAFFFHNVYLFQDTYSVKAIAFSLGQPNLLLVWPAFAVGIWLLFEAVINSNNIVSHQ